MRSTIRVMDAPLRRLPEGHCHVQRSDRQIPFHAVADHPANHPPRVKVEDDREIQPALAGLDIGDVTRPFLVWPGQRKVLVQQVGCDVERVVAVCSGLVFMSSDGFDVVLAHQAAHAPVPDAQPQVLQLFGHARPAIAL